MRDYLIIIPARYNSSRFPGKPLIKIKGKSMVQRVWEKCVKASDKNCVIIATDDQRILNHCKEKKMNCIITSKTCLTGTDRLFEVSKKKLAKFYINVQGDEPLISISDIKKIIKVAKKNPKVIFNGMCKISNKKDFINPNVPKVVTDHNNKLLYMSRASIPTDKKHKFHKAMKQVCIYSFPKKMLEIYGNKRNKSKNELIEDIEILRFNDLGYDVQMIKLSESSIAVDTPSDLKKVKHILNDRN